MLGYILALLIGLSLGILGGGGSILTVPIFVYVMGFTPKQAIAMSLPVVGTTSLVGSLRYWVAGAFDIRVALVFGALAMLGARLGAELAKHLSGVFQLSLLGVVMLVAAVLMVQRPAGVGDAAKPTSGPERDRSARAVSYVATAVVGCTAGVLTGLVGIGGGFLFVPALVLFRQLPIKTAAGTSLFVIALSTLSGSIGYRGQVAIPWTVVAIFTVIAVVGIFVGTRLVQFISAPALRRGFAYFLFLMAAFILIQNRAVLLHPSATVRPSSAGAR